MLPLFQSLKAWLLAVFAIFAVLSGIHTRYDLQEHGFQSLQYWVGDCVSDTLQKAVKDNEPQLSEHNKIINSDEKNKKNQNIKILINDDSQKEELAKLGLTDNPVIHIKDINKKIHGRFLHITDMHPDMFYNENASTDRACHSGKGSASKYGDAFTNCDAPYILVKETIEWIDRNLKDKIDFVIWTGDNVRHDNDRSIPRTEFQIFETNENISSLLFESFKDRKSLDPRQMLIPLIPSVGNNDVYPHNLLALGPTLQTRLMYKSWSNYIPQDQAHVFEQNACFMVEVIPNQLAVISLNTLFLFKSNPLVDNCDQKRQPGYSIFLWLGFTLKELRKRNMKVWISGHVPPVPKNYDLTCYRKYVLWIYEFRDIIIGSVFGHMNLDHFLPLDAESAYKSLKEDTAMPGYSDLVSAFSALTDEGDREDDREETSDATISLKELYSLFGLSTGDHEVNKYESAYLSSELHALGASPGVNKIDYMNDVSEIFYSKLVSYEDVESQKKKNKKKKKKYSVDPNSRYSIAHVAGSVIPTFNPAFRIWEYNITDLDNILSSFSNPRKQWDEFFIQVNSKIDEILSDEEYNDEFDDIFGNNDDLATVMKKKHKKKHKKKQKKNDKTLPKQSPTNMTLGPAFLGQTFSPTRFVQYYLDLAKHNSVNNGENKIEYTVEYTSDSGPYKMDSLLVDDWVKYGKALSTGQTKKKSKNNKYWKAFLERVFITSDYEEWVKKNKKDN